MVNFGYDHKPALNYAYRSSQGDWVDPIESEVLDSVLGTVNLCESGSIAPESSPVGVYSDDGAEDLDTME